MPMEPTTNPYQSPGTSGGADSPTLAMPVGDAGEISVEYEVAIEDLVQLCIHNNLYAPAGRKIYRTRRILVPGAIVLCGVLLLLLRLSDVMIYSGYGLTAFGVFLALRYRSAFIRSLRNVATRMYRGGENRGVLGLKRISIAPEQVVMWSPEIVTTALWSTVERIDSSEHAAYFYLSALSAFVVPRRAFHNAAEFDSFVEMAESYRQGATTPLPADGRSRQGRDVNRR